jgi:hypothetical protein
VVLAYTANTSALLAVLSRMAAQTDVLAGQVEQGFGQHPDAKIYGSQPGLGVILGVRGASRIRDDPDRYVDTKARKNYSGRSPITKASETKQVVLARSPATAASAMHCSTRPSPHSTFSSAPAPCTTGSAPVERPTTKPSERQETGSSASFTAGYEATPSTTNTSPGIPNQTNSALLLDRLRSWDV